MISHRIKPVFMLIYCGNQLLEFFGKPSAFIISPLKGVKEGWADNATGDTNDTANDYGPQCFHVTLLHSKKAPAQASAHLILAAY
jgi:hypothetical protein